MEAVDQGEATSVLRMLRWFELFFGERIGDCKEVLSISVDMNFPFFTSTLVRFSICILQCFSYFGGGFGN